MKISFAFKIFSIFTVLVATGCSTTKPKNHHGHSFSLKFFLESKEIKDEPSFQIAMPVSGIAFTVYAAPVLTEHSMQQSVITNSDLGKMITFYVNPAFTPILSEVIATHPQSQLVVVVNDDAVGFARLQDCSGTSIPCFLELTDAQLNNLNCKVNATARKHPKKI